MSAVGSTLSMDSHRLIPRPSLLNPPAQSSRRLPRDIALDRGLVENAERDARRVDEFECGIITVRTTATAVRKATV